MKTIIEMAHEAGGILLSDSEIFGLGFEFEIYQLERFAELVRADEREACGRVRAAKPRKLNPVGRGVFLDEQQFCFDKGWSEGAASVRAAIRARGNK